MDESTKKGRKSVCKQNAYDTAVIDHLDRLRYLRRNRHHQKRQHISSPSSRFASITFSMVVCKSSRRTIFLKHFVLGHSWDIFIATIYCLFVQIKY